MPEQFVCIEMVLILESNDTKQQFNGCLIWVVLSGMEIRKWRKGNTVEGPKVKRLGGKHFDFGRKSKWEDSGHIFLIGGSPFSLSGILPLSFLESF